MIMHIYIYICGLPDSEEIIFLLSDTIEGLQESCTLNNQEDLLGDLRTDIMTVFFYKVQLQANLWVYCFVCQ